MRSPCVEQCLTTPHNSTCKQAKPQSRQSKHQRDSRCDGTLRECTEKHPRQTQHHITKHAAKTNRHWPTFRHGKAARDGCKQQSSTHPCKAALHNPAYTAARHEQQRPDDQRKQNRNTRKAEELHCEIGKYGTGIAKRVGYGIIRGMTKTGVSNIPCRKRTHSRSGQRKQPQPKEDIELPAEDVGQFQPVFRNPLVTQRV